MFTPLDADELASAVVEMAGHSGAMREMGIRARELSRRFDLEQVVSRQEAILTAVSNGEPIPAFER